MKHPYLRKNGLLSLQVFACLLVFGGLISCQPSIKDDSFAVVNFKVETLLEPVMSDEAQPRYSWELSSDQRGLHQSHYQVMVATTSSQLEGDSADVWDSGKIKSSRSVQVSYEGPSLKSCTTYFCKVRVWCEGKGYNDSPVFSWSTGMLKQSDWKAAWIGMDSLMSGDEVKDTTLRLTARYLRREFELEDQPIAATVYLTGIGAYRLFLNDLPIGGQVISPTPTPFSQEVTYTSYELSPYLLAGKNVFGLVLGNGAYSSTELLPGTPAASLNFPKALFQLEMILHDGKRARLVSDTAWRITNQGSIRSNHLQMGEAFDANKELTHCFMKGYDASDWLPVKITSAPGNGNRPARLRAQRNEDVKMVVSTTPKAILSKKTGSFILDMGQNISGWLRLQLNPITTRTITLRYAERLNPDSTLFSANANGKFATDIVTLKGGKETLWEPSFSYHGFRFVEVLNWSGTPSVYQFSGLTLSDGFGSTGSFVSANTTLNAMYKNAWWTVGGNYKGMPLDGAHPFDRKPTLKYRSNSCLGESFLFNNQRLYAKWLDDIQQSMNAKGQLPDAAPARELTYSDDITGAATYFLVAHILYRQFADERVVKQHYPSMKKWMSYMESHHLKNGLMHSDAVTDEGVPPLNPVNLNETDPNRLTNSTLISTAYYIKILQVMQQFAELVGSSTDIERYAKNEEALKKAFQRQFYRSNKSSYDNNTVTANLLPLAFDITPKTDQQAVFKTLCRVIEQTNQGHLSTGVVGTTWLLQTLSRFGRSDLALRLASNRTYPSWGYMVEKGATTLWERWNGDIQQTHSADNHVALLGDMLNWCYENLAGIQCDTKSPGYSKFVLRPDFPEGLSFVKSKFISIHGKIVSEWSREGVHLTWLIGVPHNTEAMVYIPAPKKNIYEGEVQASKANGVTFVKTEGDRSVFRVESGIYTFKVTY